MMKRWLILLISTGLMLHAQEGEQENAAQQEEVVQDTAQTTTPVALEETQKKEAAEKKKQAEKQEIEKKEQTEQKEQEEKDKAATAQVTVVQDVDVVTDEAQPEVDVEETEETVVEEEPVEEAVTQEVEEEPEPIQPEEPVEEAEPAQPVEEVPAVDEETIAARELLKEEQEMKATQMEEDEQTKEEQAPDFEEIEGIDTADLEVPQGNWLFKRVWWERAENKYDKIRATVQAIFEMRMAFFNKRNEIDKFVLDPFYIAIGLRQGELLESIETQKKKLTEQREKLGGVLDNTKRDQEQKLNNQEEIIKQLQEDVQAIATLDDQLNDALTRLMEQINRVRTYEQESWKNFKEIARVLDDKKARELYYKIEVAWENIKDIQEYIRQAFAPNYRERLERLNEQVNRVKAEIEEVASQGIEIKPLKVQAPTDREEVEVEEEEEEVEEPGFIASYLINPIKSLGSFTWSVIAFPYRLIFGFPTDESAEDDELDDVIIEEETEEE